MVADVEMKKGHVRKFQDCVNGLKQRLSEENGPCYPHPTLLDMISQFSWHPLCHKPREIPLSGRGCQENCQPYELVSLVVWCCTLHVKYDRIRNLHIKHYTIRNLLI